MTEGAGPGGVERVVVVNDHSIANGGTAALALLSVRRLRARGLKVTLVCGDAGDNAELRALGVEVVAAGGADLLKRGRADAAARGLYDPATRALLARVVAQDTPGTVYHVHGWAQILSPSIFRALRPVAARTFLHAHDSFLACPNGMYMDYPRNMPCTRVPLSADCLATNCDKRSYPQKLWRAARHATLFSCLDRQGPWAGLFIIHPGVARNFTRAGYPDGLLRVLRNPATPYSADRVRAEDNRELVYVGRLEADKGVMDLVRAAERTEMPLRLIGDGSLHGEIARDHPGVILSGWQTPERIGALVTGARALVMPSHHPEPFALVIPEAVQSGLPVLVSETAALAGEVRSGGFGLSFDVFDLAATDTAFATLRDMPAEDLAAMSRRGQADGGALSHTTDSWIDAMLEHYAGAVAQDALRSAPRAARG